MSKTREELEGAQIIVEGYLDQILYPYGKKEVTNEYAVFWAKDLKLIEGEIPEEEGGDHLCYLKFSGVVSTLEHGTKYTFVAVYENHKKYGWQYKLVSNKRLYNPDNLEDFYNYLNGAKIVTEVQFESIKQAKFDVMAAIKAKDVNKLRQLHGVGKITAQKIIWKYFDKLHYGLAFQELSQFGLTQTAIQKIVDRYKDADIACKVIKENPYILAEEVKGYGWNKADALALKMGFDPDGEKRVCAYIKYFLKKQAEENGHSWVELNDLTSSILVIAPLVAPSNLQTWIGDMIKNGELYYSKLDNGEGSGKPLKRIGLMSLRRIEEEISNNLMRLKNAPNWEFPDIEATIREAEAISGYPFTEQQKEVVKMISENKVTLVTAMAGSGKSSTMLPVALALKKMGKKVEQVALSGKASLNLTEITHQNGQTIHRLLGYRPQGEIDKNAKDSEDGDGLEKFETPLNEENYKKKKTSNFNYDKENQLEVDAVILDEVSMIGGGLFLNLIEAIPDHAKLILIGDEGQLEAIGYCNILYDIKKSGIIPSYRLTQILRQNARSGIISDSAKVYNKQTFLSNTFAGEETHGELQDFKIISTTDNYQTKACALEEYKRILGEGVSPENIVVATYKRSAGPLSAFHLSAEIQKIANPFWDKPYLSIPYIDTAVKDESITFKFGDLAMVTMNNYSIPTELEWVTQTYDSWEEVPPLVGAGLTQNYTIEEIKEEFEKVDIDESYSDDFSFNHKRGGSEKRCSGSIFNGNIGTIKWIDDKEQAVCVTFNSGTFVFSAKKEWDQTLFTLVLGYAVTTHKLQGSGFPYVIAVMDSSAYTLSTNEALYTQITRAKKWCTLIGPTKLINSTVHRTFVRTKNTWLGELLLNEEKILKNA